ncbi:MAG TPA: 16S rRNA (cytosine(967)-C(5))-methyltransferase RsmB [Pyrinomonadaceae bacterium]|nr:16S rRNA (cytosine(967)-C(5))-methyltransferase RsmB [Pyrinomonadaceae bacterium]
MATRSGVMKKESVRGGGGQPVSPARLAAFEILRRVEDEGSFAAPLLAGGPFELTPEDRALCYELVLGVLRWQLWLDALASHYAARPSEKLDAPVRRALRLGLYQLRFLARVPARAAVNESVNLARAARLRSAAPFINAVLRRAVREPDFDPAAGLTEPLQRISVETSHPLWLVKRWAEQLDSDEAAAFARANNFSAPTAFRVNRLCAAESEVFERLREAGVEVSASRVAPGAWRVAEGRGGIAATLLRTLTGEGHIYLQDEASQLVAHVLGARAGERVLDACAAPGSKTTHLATLAGDAALVVAGDVYEHRLRLVNEAAERQGLKSISTVVLDAEATLPFAGGTFERVLVDAPCTGTGTLRHNPEIRWRITPGDILELASKQRRIIEEAARVLGPGGRLIYSTCSVEREENEEVVASFLAAHDDFRQVEARPAHEALLTETGAARTWPQRDGVDGFFVAALAKR